MSLVCSREHAQSAAQAARAKKLFRATLEYKLTKQEHISERVTSKVWLLDTTKHIHLIQKRLSSALLHTQTTKHHGCYEFVHCCMTRPQSILFHIASMANTRMLLSPISRYLRCYLKLRYIHGALRSGYATIRNAQYSNSEDNFFFN